jgi:hypothetical protein
MEAIGVNYYRLLDKVLPVGDDRFMDCLLPTCGSVCRSQWPRGLRRMSMAAHLLRSLVRIPPGHGCLSVMSVMCCQVEFSATS